MKPKEIKKIIKLNMDSHIPDQAPRLDIEWAKPKSVPLKSPRAFHFKLILSTGLAVLILAITIALWPNGGLPPNPSEKLLKSDHEIISFSAVSSISLISTMGTNELISLPATLQATEEPEVITRVLPYLRTVEQLLLSDSGLNIVTGISDLPEYETFMQFETRNLLGGIKTYVMHYNMVLVDEDDDESEYSLEGILIFGENTYQVIGEKEIEDDEESVKFKAFKDASNYVESTYKIENDEQTFEFKVVQNGLTVSESKFEIEFDQDETKVKLSFKEGNNEGTFEFEYFTEDGLNFIKIEFEIDLNNQSSSGEMIVQMVTDPLTGITVYRIQVDPDDEESYEYDKEDDDDDEDDEDEEDEEDDEDDEEDDEDEEDEEDDEEDDEDNEDTVE